MLSLAWMMFFISIGSILNIDTKKRFSLVSVLKLNSDLLVDDIFFIRRTASAF